ncbi:type VII secretion target [Actinoplanes sp. KI2]|uniref:type VII secretion target n=1 Tax=Actinoplanes sp. KI2 TaxID=2983315 RepID=UPI0021D594B1|nr:type VII secretion target [Actinoplanes sp. KI2]MCU7723283.1 type VII secretion target [Actinoplanes sp. KI2]
MNPDLEVHTEELRRTASALTTTAVETAATATATPPAERTPRWRTTDAAALAVEAVQQQLRHLGAGVEETARLVTAAAAAYAEADARAAVRLRLTR